MGDDIKLFLLSTFILLSFATLGYQGGCNVKEGEMSNLLAENLCEKTSDYIRYRQKPIEEWVKVLEIKDEYKTRTDDYKEFLKNVK